MGKLERAWRVLQARWRDSPPSLQGVRGPSAATWLSLKRVGLDMTSSTKRRGGVLFDAGGC
eukprot:2931166-Pyramimonas_sp.AAC.1